MIRGLHCYTKWPIKDIPTPTKNEKTTQKKKQKIKKKKKKKKPNEKKGAYKKTTI